MTELGLFTCVLATLFGFVRIFGNYGYLGRMTIVAATASLLAAILRRRGVGVIVSTLAHIAVGVVIISNLYLPAEVSNWFPTPHTLGMAYSTMAEELVALRTAVPPIDAGTGILLVMAVLAWLLVLFADTAAMRVHATVQAVLPLVVVFVAVGVSQPGFDRVSAIIVFTTAIGTYALVVHNSRARTMRWAGTARDAARGTARLSSIGLVMSIVVLVAVTATGTMTPVSDPVITLRHNDGGRGREVVSPFVSIRSLLGTRSNTPMFRVTTDLPSYWRLTALDTYDSSKDIWISSGEYKRAGSTLSKTTDPTVETTMSDQHFEILRIGGPWVPMVFEADRYEGRFGVTFNDLTSTLFADEDLVEGKEYEITSAVPTFETGALASSRRPTFDEVDERLLRVPIESAAEHELINEITADSDSVYESLIALQNQLRTEFEYAEDVDYSTSDDPVTAFLTERAGFCQQFSSVFAITARRLGLPSRVAVGFTMGETVDDDAPSDDHLTIDSSSSSSSTGDTDGSQQTYLVRGMHAHAWPEVYFHDLGWVAFEPTPGRGNPATAAYTGVVAAQAEVQPEEDTADPTASTAITDATPPATDPATSTPDQSTPGVTTPGQSDQAGAAENTADDDSDRTPLRILIATLTIGVIATAAFAVLRQRRRRHSDDLSTSEGDPASSALADAWDTVVHALYGLGLSPSLVETPSEFASRVSAHLGAPNDSSTDPRSIIAAELSTLASIETLRRYSPVFDVPGERDDELIAGLISEADQRSAEIVSSVAVLQSAEVLNSAEVVS